MKNIYIFAFLVLFSCTHSKKTTTNKLIDLGTLRGATLPKYKVLKIDSIQNVYIIYAERNNLTYKIVSAKSSVSICRNAYINNEYGLMLHSLFAPQIVIEGDTLPRRQELVNSVDFNGATIATEAGCVDDIFSAENIEGLCIKWQ
jgi:hypothetical protein